MGMDRVASCVGFPWASNVDLKGWTSWVTGVVEHLIHIPLVHILGRGPLSGLRIKDSKVKNLVTGSHTTTPGHMRWVYYWRSQTQSIILLDNEPIIDFTNRLYMQENFTSSSLYIYIYFFFDDILSCRVKKRNLSIAVNLSVSPSTLSICPVHWHLSWHWFCIDKCCNELRVWNFDNGSKF